MSDIAAPHLRRIVALLSRYGEDFTLTRAGVNRSLRGLFAPMDNTTVSTFFDANESVGLIRPALSLCLDGSLSDPPIADDIFFRDGRLWTVRKTHFFRLSNTVQLILTLCD